MKKRSILATLFAIAVGIVVMSSTAAEGGRGLPNRAMLEDFGSKDERGKNGRYQGRRWNRGARMLRGLDLTEDQRQQMGEIKRLFREEVRELYTAHRENMRGVLTPGQQDTLRMRMERIKRYRENNRPGKREENPRERWPDHWRGNFLDRINTDEDGAAKPTVDKPVATEGDQTTWGKIKNLFE